MAEVGSLWVRLRGDTADFDKAMAGVTKKLGATGERMKEIGSGMTSSVTLPILAIGAGAIAAATEVEGAMAQIRASTGATGDELAALRDDFEAVAKKVPQDFMQVATAVGDLNTRLGLTGEPLRKLTEQMLELADLTKTQVEPLIASTTRVFGDWGVATDDQSKTLDTLYIISQKTGIQVDRLSESLVAYGAPLRSMGFTLEESAVLMGKWETEGVNMELVLGSLRIAMGHFAREGIPMREGLDDTIARIQELGPGAEATALAMEIFGARAGPDMAAAILEGRFEMDELMASVQASSETIMAAGLETETFADKLKILGREATFAIEPIGVRLMDALTNIMPQITNVINVVAGLADKFAALSPETQNTILTIVGLIAALGPAFMIIGKLITVISSIITFVAKFKAGFAAVKLVLLVATAKILIIIAVIAALAAGIYYLVTNWETVSATLKQIWEDISAKATEIFESILQFLADTWNTIREQAEGVWSGIIQYFTVTVPAGLQAMVDWFAALPGRILEFLIELATAIPYWIGFALGTLVRLTIEGITAAVTFFSELPGRVWEFLKQLGVFISQTFTLLRTTMVTLVSEAVEAVVGFFTALPGRVWEFLTQLVTDMVAIGRQVLDTIHTEGSRWVTAIQTAASDLVTGFMDRIRKLPDDVWTTLMNLRDTIKNAAGALLKAAKGAATSLWDGFRQGLGMESPSYLERAMTRIVDTSHMTLDALRTDFGALGQLQMRAEGVIASPTAERQFVAYNGPSARQIGREVALALMQAGAI